MSFIWCSDCRHQQ